MKVSQLFSVFLVLDIYTPVTEQRLATPVSSIVEVKYAEITEEGWLRFTGSRTPPVRMSDTASETINQFVYVRGTLLKQTKEQTRTFNTTIRTARALSDTTR